MSFETRNIENNDQSEYVFISPTSPQFAIYPNEESLAFPHFRSGWTSGGNDAIYETDNQYGKAYRLSDGQIGSDDAHQHIPINSAISQTGYIGMGIMDIPYNINPEFADLKLMDFVNNNVGDFANANVHENQFEQELFTSNVNSNNKIVNINSGLQGLKIPATRLQDSNGENKYGTYFIRVAPKYVKTSIKYVQRGRHYDFANLSSFNNPADAYDNARRRTTVGLPSSDFANTVWNFENILSGDAVRGFMMGSVVEVWDASESNLKTTKVMAENSDNLNNPNGPTFLAVLEPQIAGYDHPQIEISSGDVLYVYPRQTYFHPINIKLDFVHPSKNAKNAFDHMMNDAVRDTESGVLSVYDENGVEFNNQGQPIGNVIQSYQTEQHGKFEVRKRLKPD